MADTTRHTVNLMRLSKQHADHIPLILNDEFAPWIADWELTAMGKRPKDYIGRDLLFGSLGRDYRAGLYHRLQRDPPEWIRAQSRNVGGKVAAPSRAVSNHLFLRSIHAYSLSQLWRSGLADESGSRLHTLGLLACCPPMGFCFARAAHTGDGPLRSCRQARLCPWCHCRKVVALYSRLIDGPCNPAEARQKILVMGKIRIDDETGGSVQSELLTRERVERVIATWRPRLRAFAARLGLTGGILAHQVGPVLLPDGCRSFRHELSVLGEVDFDRDGQWDEGGFARFQREAGLARQPGEQPTLDGAIGRSETAAVEVTIMRMADRKSLRWLLAGSPAHRGCGSEAYVMIARNEAALPKGGSGITRQTLGVDGALALQPTFLFTADQFWSYASSMKGGRLFSAFGGWCGIGDGECEGGLTAQEADVPCAAIDRLNDSRRWSATRDLKRLMELTRPTYDRLTAEAAKPPGRVVFARALEEEGHVVPTRRVVQLLGALRPD